jgi:hypothetical protein
LLLLYTLWRTDMRKKTRKPQSLDHAAENWRKGMTDSSTNRCLNAVEPLS